jgi:hypothetical protein
MTTGEPGSMAFYLVEDAFSEDTLRFMPAGWAEDAPAEFLYALGRGEAQPPAPLRLEWGLGGDQPADWLWGEPSAIMVISDRLRQELKQAGVTGWKTYPTEPHDEGGRALRGFHGLAVTGRAGPRDTTRGRVITYNLGGPASEDYQVRRGLFFDTGSWDGSDMFMLAGSLWLVVTERARAVLTAAHAPDLRMTPAADVEIDVAL